MTTEAPLVALATPWGRSALAVVRLTGPGCHAVVRAIARPLHAARLEPGRPRRAVFVDADGGVVDDGIAWLQAGPRTYTGEDAAELTVHGNPLIVERLLAAAIAAGAAPAGPGAFTRRAVEHGRLDPIRAEAVAQTIEASSVQGLAAARQALDGSLGASLQGLRERLVTAIAELEARLDVPGDETADLDDEALQRDLADLADTASAWVASAGAGHHLVHGARVALVGAVNAGKSSLLNALVGRTRALVSPSPGTTRDVVEVPGQADGLAVTWLDTAGERSADDPVEAAGQALARTLTDEADLLVVVLRARPDGPDATERQILARTAGRPRVVVLNGVEVDHASVPEATVHTVATRGEGVPALATAVRRSLVGELPADAVPVIASLHQARALRAMVEAVREALAAWGPAGVAVAAELLHDGVAALDGLTGADTREDVLDALFARFCVGK